MAEAHAGVQKHYASADIVARVLAALREAGENTEKLTPPMLYSFDQFHGGGIGATEANTSKLGLGPASRVIDVGSGIGGPARYMATTYGCRVSGIDLTPEFVAAAVELTRRCGLADKVDFRQGNALSLPFPDASFDAATCFNVTMNIDNKQGVLNEIARVLKPGGRLAYTETGLGAKPDPIFPLPWARKPDVSFLVTPAKLREVFEAAGLRILEFVDETGTHVPAPSQLSRLGNRVVVGDDFVERVKNMSINQQEGRLVSSFILAGRD